jgi:hypothetical protein
LFLPSARERETGGRDTRDGAVTSSSEFMIGLSLNPPPRLSAPDAEGRRPARPNCQSARMREERAFHHSLVKIVSQRDPTNDVRAAERNIAKPRLDLVSNVIYLFID